MSFAPQRPALFQHLNFQKCSDVGVLCTFWLGNVLRATTPCNFSSAQLPQCSEPGVRCTFWLGNVLRATTACNFSSLIWPAGSAPAALASLLFDPPEPQIIGKTQCFATFLPFREPGFSFFGDFIFFDLLSSSLIWLFLPSLYHVSILSEVWLLNFLRLHVFIIKYNIAVPFGAFTATSQWLASACFRILFQVIIQAADYQDSFEFWGDKLQPMQKRSQRNRLVLLLCSSFPASRLVTFDLNPTPAIVAARCNRLPLCSDWPTTVLIVMSILLHSLSLLTNLQVTPIWPQNAHWKSCQSLVPLLAPRIWQTLDFAAKSVCKLDWQTTAHLSRLLQLQGQTENNEQRGSFISGLGSRNNSKVNGCLASPKGANSSFAIQPGQVSPLVFSSIKMNNVPLPVLTSI